MRRIQSAGLALAGLILGAPLAAGAATFAETFTDDPAPRGWRIFGESALFHWDATNQNLEVTWDSSRTNSYFYRPLGTVLARDDDFGLSFDLRPRDIAVGTTPDKPFTFQIAIGFFRLAQATNAGFWRGAGDSTPNLVEFDYFPDSGFGATISPTLVSSNNEFAYSFNYPFELTPNDLFHVEMRYAASNQTLVTTMTRNGAAFGPIDDAKVGAGFSDFRVDAVSISSYSDVGQDPRFSGSILAHGVVDNLVITTPPPPIAALKGGWSEAGVWQVQFLTRTNWSYALERTADFQSWTTVANITGDGGQAALPDPDRHSGQFYRVRAERP